MEFTDTFWKLYGAWEKHPRYIDSQGGTRSGKTFSALQLFILLAKTDKQPTITSVVSETMPHLKRGAIRDFQAILGSEWSDAAWSKVESIYTFPNGARIEFFSADQPGKVHGPARDRLFVNEAVNIDYETFRQLAVRTRDFIIIDYNPTHAFWAHEHIAPRDNCVSINSTYQDNNFLTAAQRLEIESNRDDANWWRVYGEGKVGQLDGLIYDFEQIDEMPDAGDMVETYGMDFGFTNDPTTLIHALIDTGRKVVYFDEVCYQRGMLNADIAAMMEREGVPKYGPMIFADSAEPKTIAELGGYGWNVLPCYKATRKAEQIQLMRGYKQRITKRSLNLIREHRGYTWAKDKDGHSLNEPIAINDHAEDAARYALVSFLAQYAGSGSYSFGFGSDYGY